MENTIGLGPIVERLAGSNPVSPTIPYSEGKVLGPYTLPSGRKHITYLVNNHKINIAYARYLKELELGRYLASNEVVHHLDGDKTNDSTSNLQVLTKAEHLALHNSVLNEIRHCLGCGKEIYLSGLKLSTLKSNLKRGKTGPWCSSCRPVNQYS